MKILCVCHAGAVRSVAMADILRQKYDQDAMSISWDKASLATWSMMCEWADRIFLCEEYQWAKIAEPHKPKTRLLPLGVDIWGSAHHPALRAVLPGMLEAAMR